MPSVRINVTPRIAPGQRIASVDELKGLAIVLVMLYHCGGVLGDGNVIHGEVGVDIFLILSGLTLALNSTSMSLGKFFQRRLLRIYPSYWLALGLFLLMSHHFFAPDRTWADVWLHVIGLHAYSRFVYFADINDSFWFISMILVAYVVFAAVRNRLDNFSLLFGLTGFLTLVATVIYQECGHMGGLISLAVRIPSFFVGVIAGRLLGAGTAEIRFDLFMGLGLLSFYYLTFFRGIACNYTLPAIAIILTWVGLRQLLVRCVEGRIVSSALSYLGVISYEVYLFHQPLVRDYNIYIFHNPVQPTHWQILKGIYFGLGVAFTLAVGVHFAVKRLFSAVTGKSRLAPRAVPA